MAVTFTKLSEVTLADKAADVANVLIEENGEIKRVAKTEVGGSNANTVIIKSSDYDSAVASLTSLASEPM